MWTKFGICAVILAAVLTVWGLDRHFQYEKGKLDCINAQQAAQIEKAPEAIKKASEASKKLAGIENEKQLHKEQARQDAVKANRPDSCDLSNDELLRFNEAIKDANG